MARALIKDPKILLLDEPFSSLGQLHRKEFLDMIRAHAAKKEVTVVYVTHDIKEALLSGEHIVVLDEGKVIMQGNADEVYCSSHPTIVAMRLDCEAVVPSGKE